MRPILRNLFWAFVVVLLGFTYRACAQDVIPDAPVSHCTVASWSTDMTHIVYKDVDCRLLPQTYWTTSSQPAESSKQASFFTFRTKWNDPPLRTNKQVLKSPVFWISQGALWLTIIPHGRARWHVEPAEAGGLFTFDYLSERLFCECFAVGPPAYALGNWLSR